MTILWDISIIGLYNKSGYNTNNSAYKWLYDGIITTNQVMRYIEIYTLWLFDIDLPIKNGDSVILSSLRQITRGYIEIYIHRKITTIITVPMIRTIITINIITMKMIVIIMIVIIWYNLVFHMILINIISLIPLFIIAAETRLAMLTGSFLVILTIFQMLFSDGIWGEIFYWG